jgi:glycosyltransferase involved in cell wall biosynthesis
VKSETPLAMTILYSVIIPAYNEAAWLAKSLPALAAAMATTDAAGEVIVVDNNSSDRTAAVAAGHGVRVVFEPHNQISRARNAGARAACGRYLVFLDADTTMSAELLHSLIASLSGGGCCGGGALVRFDATLPIYARWILRLWNRLAVRRQWAAGCFIFCLREGYEGIGGFNERLFASEEIWFSKRLREWGTDKGLEFTILAAPPIVTSARKMQDHPLRNFLAFCFMLAFPVAVFSRRLSYLWYYRKG